MEFNPQNFGTNLYDQDRAAIYFYRVIQDVAAFKDGEVVNSYHHVEDFNDTDIRKARQEAIHYLTERYRTLPEGFFFHIFRRRNMPQIQIKNFLPIHIVSSSSNFIVMKYLKSGRLPARMKRMFARDWHMKQQSG